MTGPIGQVEDDEGFAGPPGRDDAWIDGVIAARGAEWVAARLDPFVTPARRGVIEAVLAARVDSVSLAIEDPKDPRNVAAIVRSAEALGAGTVHAIAPRSFAVVSPRVTRGAFYWASVALHASWGEFVAAIDPGVVLVGACVARDGETLPLARVPVDRPLCLVFGNERAGLSAAARRRCDLRFTIPMYGMSESLNVSASAAIALYDVLARRREVLGGRGDLPAGRRAALRARWMAKSIDERLLRALLGGAP